MSVEDAEYTGVLLDKHSVQSSTEHETEMLTRSVFSSRKSETLFLFVGVRWSRCELKA